MTVDLKFLFVLLVVFQIKHFISDFALQREFMLKKTLPGWSFLLPLSFHCFVHAFFTLIIVMLVNIDMWWLAIFDFCIHFLVDRFKSSPRFLGRFNDNTKSSFWVTLGFDQMAHHFTHYVIIWQLIHSISI